MASYRDFVALGETEEIERFYSLKNLPAVFGGEMFKEWIEDQFQYLSLRDEKSES